MVTVTANFYILLGLSFDPPVTDPVEIKTAITRKKQQWTRWQDNPSRRSLALKYLDLVPEIQRVMLDDKLREEQARQAVELRDEILRQFKAELRILEGKGYLTPKDVTSVAVKYKAYGITEEMVKEHARCPVSDGPPEPQEGEDAGGEVLDRVTSKQIQRSLSVLGLPDLYEFLGLPPYSSIKKLGAAAEDKRREAGTAGKTAVASATQELAGLCLQVFQDFASKQRYDRFLKVSRYPELGEMIDMEHGRSRYISPALLLRLVNFGVERYGIGVLEAEEYIRYYCAAYDIPVDSKSPTIACPACAVQVPREAVVCPSCAAPLRGECPGCGAKFSEGSPICPDCGFALGGMVKALRHIEDAENAAIENNWGIAQRNLQYAKKYWPGHPQIAPLEKRARGLEDRYAKYMDDIGDCVRHSQYYAALELVEQAEMQGIRLPASTANHVRKVIADLEKELEKLTKGGKEPAVEKVLDLASTVSDSLELSRMMKRHPPQAPDRLSAQLSGSEVRLNWTRSASPGLLDYVVVRKEGSAPITAFDGDVIYDGPQSSYTDTAPPSLREVHYGVFTKRSGSYSDQGALAKPVLLVPEIQNLKVLPTDQGAQITWDYNPHIREVRIWRKLGGDRPTGPEDGIRLENNRVDGFTDSKIKNDVEYWYYLCAVYMVDGKQVLSPGVSENVMPHRFVAPIEGLVAVRTDTGRDEYVANWEGTTHHDVQLFASPEPPAFKKGEIVLMQDLLARYHRLHLNMRGNDSANFHYPLNGGIYLFVVSLLGKFASVGQTFYLTNVSDVTNAKCEIVDGQPNITMDWPQGLSEIAVAYRFDTFPKVPDELGTTVMRITKEQYDYDHAVIFREPEQVTYYARVFAVFITPSGGRVYSPGVEVEVDNSTHTEVFYRMKYKKSPFSKSGTMTITLSSSEVFHLPKAVFVGKIGRLPLNKTDGMPLFELEKEARVNGEIVYQYRTNALPKDLYLRMFLHDDRGYKSLRLLPGSAPKLT